MLTRDHVAGVADPEELSTGYKSLRLLGTVLIGVPAFIGAFWGAPLLAHELEAGTHRLAWTQSVTRRRWLATNSPSPPRAAVIVPACSASLFTWWSLPFDRFGNRIGTANFGQRGIAPIAYAVFASRLGTLAGAVLRRTLPAMAATLVGFFVVRFGFQTWVRSHLIGVDTVTVPAVGINPGQGATGHVLGVERVDAAGRLLTETRFLDLCGFAPHAPERRRAHRVHSAWAFTTS